MSTGALVFSDSKKHYPILDGLRGVAAVMVVIFHLLETFTMGDHTKQIINHGYLAVDFFFLLSGFVIGYAYDDRWGKMSIGGFFKRRLIRLHPMIIMAMVIGAVLFYFQDSEAFPNIHGTPPWKLIVVMLVGFTLLPLPLSWDIRGWTEMHPLVGPAWSLFFEYIGNLLYALIIRRLPTIALWVLVALAAAALIHLGLTSPQGDVIGGWALEPTQLKIGFTRLLYPFLAGLLLSRIAKPGNLPHAFLWCSLLLIVVFSLPRIGSNNQFWMNGLYDALTIIIVFPLVVFMGASGTMKENFISRISNFLGDISYPLYIIHYPFIYLFTSWVVNNKDFLQTGSSSAILQVVLMALGVLITTIVLAWLCVKFYDVPVRKWLTQKFMVGSKSSQ